MTRGGHGPRPQASPQKNTVEVVGNSGPVSTRGKNPGLFGANKKLTGKVVAKHLRKKLTFCCITPRFCEVRGGEFCRLCERQKGEASFRGGRLAEYKKEGQLITGGQLFRRVGE